MWRIRTALVGAWLATSALAAGPQPVQVLETGSFHGDEVATRTGDRWFGLYRTATGVQAAALPVTVTPVHDPLVDAPDESSGKLVTVPGPPPLFLVRRLSGLQPGPVPTAASELTLAAGVVPLRLGRTAYGLETRVLREDAATGGMREGELVFRRGRDRQVLFATGADGGELAGAWKLVWAGDLDGDGALDLYVHVSSHYNVSSHRLFLSGAARAGRLVEEAAEFTITGC